MSDTLERDRRRAIERLVAAIATPLDGPGPTTDALADLIARGWRNPELFGMAVAMASTVAAGLEAGVVGDVDADEVAIELVDGGGVGATLAVRFDRVQPALVARVAVVPRLRPGLVVRVLDEGDAAALRRLERDAPIERSGGTKVVVDHDGGELQRHALVPGMRILGVFDGPAVVAVQTTSTAPAPIGGVERIVAFNRGSRTDPASRREGHFQQLIARLYGDLFAEIDQWVSLVDPENEVGLAVSGGEPWPSPVDRLFLPVDRLADRPSVAATRTFDHDHAAAILDETHDGLALYRRRSGVDVATRLSAAPHLYGPDDVAVTDGALVGCWPTVEQRTYERDGVRSARRIVPVADIGCAGPSAQGELVGLLADAAVRASSLGATHLAVWVGAGDERLGWLHDLADHADRYVVCAPPLTSVPAPSERVYVDPLRL
jgi:hypothetical protein